MEIHLLKVPYTDFLNVLFTQRKKIPEPELQRTRKNREEKATCRLQIQSHPKCTGYPHAFH
jgi:hypothetical protein